MCSPTRRRPTWWRIQTHCCSTRHRVLYPHVKRRVLRIPALMHSFPACHFRSSIPLMLLTYLPRKILRRLHSYYLSHFIYCIFIICYFISLSFPFHCIFIWFLFWNPCKKPSTEFSNLVKIFWGSLAIFWGILLKNEDLEKLFWESLEIRKSFWGVLIYFWTLWESCWIFEKVFVRRRRIFRALVPVPGSPWHLPSISGKASQFRFQVQLAQESRLRYPPFRFEVPRGGAPHTRKMSCDSSDNHLENVNISA